MLLCVMLMVNFFVLSLWCIFLVRCILLFIIRICMFLVWLVDVELGLKYV